MLRILILLLCIGGVAPAFCKDASVDAIVESIQTELPFDISPRYVNFRPSDKFWTEIARYSKPPSDAKLSGLEKALRDGTNSYVSLGLIAIISNFDNPHSGEVLERYQRYLDKNEELFKTGFPDRGAIKQNLFGVLTKENHRGPLRKPDFAYFGQEQFEGVTYSFGTHWSDFSSTPNWNESDGFPPLSARKAVSVALDELKKMRPDVSAWGVETVTLDHIEMHWFYRVRCARNDGVGTGIHSIAVPVLLDGTAVHGAISQF